MLQYKKTTRPLLDYVMIKTTGKLRVNLSVLVHENDGYPHLDPKIVPITCKWKERFPGSEGSTFNNSNKKSSVVEGVHPRQQSRTLVLLCDMTYAVPAPNVPPNLFV